MDNIKPTERKYGKITFAQANEDLKQVMVSKGGQTADVSPASYGSVIREMFAAHADTLGYWTESAFNNSWLETATSQETGYVGARFLGYSVRRPLPAKAGFGLKIKRTGEFSTIKVVVPKGTTFTAAANRMTAIDDCEFVYDRNDPDYESGIMKLVSGRAVICEGQFVTTQFFSDGSKFQEFLILDPTFSNWFGDNDPNYIEPDTMDSRIGRFTTVTTDASLVDNFTPVQGHEEKIYWRIDRRGLVDPSLNKTVNDLNNFKNDGNLTLNYSCLLTTANDGRVSLEFGDGIISAIPYGLIEVSYFSTRGILGNIVNIAGTKIKPSSTDILITQMDGKESDIVLDDITFSLSTDITGGMDIETLESIKKNAPSVYASLDSLGNRSTYLRYLSSIADVKYAIAYGEDILDRYSNGVPSLKYSNIVRFSLLKDLYKQRDGKYYVTDPSEYYLQGYKTNGLTNLWDYDVSTLPDSKYIAEQDAAIDKMRTMMTYDGLTIKDSSGTTYSVSDFIAKYVPKLSTSYVPDTVFGADVKPIDFMMQGSELYNIMESLNRKGYLTLGNGQHCYVMPVVHEMSMGIDLILHSGSSFGDVKTTVTNKLFSYLQENTKFSAPLFRSALESIIQQMPETAGVNVYFTARKNGYENLELDKLTWMSYGTSKFVNQANLLEGGATTIPFTLEFDNYYLLTDGTMSGATAKSEAFVIGNQDTIKTQIRNYYISNIAYLNSVGAYEVRKNITERDLTNFTAYIWHVAMSEMYAPMYARYVAYGEVGDIKNKSMMRNLLEAMRGWYFNAGALEFYDTDYIKNLIPVESALFSYFVYTIEYIKLVRNIIKPMVAARLIDVDGNLTNYSTSHEIVQFTISPSDFIVRFDAEGYKG